MRVPFCAHPLFITASSSRDSLIKFIIISFSAFVCLYVGLIMDFVIPPSIIDKLLFYCDCVANWTIILVQQWFFGP